MIERKYFGYPQKYLKSNDARWLAYLKEEATWNSLRTNIKYKFRKIVQEEELIPEQVYNNRLPGSYEKKPLILRKKEEIAIKSLFIIFLFRIGNSCKPCAFKNLNPAWIGTYLFKECFFLPIKAVLLLDNASTHPQNITCDIADIK